MTKILETKAGLTAYIFVAGMLISTCAHLWVALLSNFLNGGGASVLETIFQVVFSGQTFVGNIILSFLFTLVYLVKFVKNTVHQ